MAAHWVWWILGVVLIGAELVTGTFYLLAVGIAFLAGGLAAWLVWLGVHIFYLIGFGNRLLVLLRWAMSFLTRWRGARLITGDEATRPTAI